MLELAIGSLITLLTSPETLSYLVLGTIIGLVFGALPGLSGVVALSLVLPLTFSLDSVNAMFLYAGIMGGNPFGGSISAILLNTPGTAVNAATCFDGYPMSQRGEAGRALSISATSSAGGAIFGVIVLILCFPLIRLAVTAFGAPETFMFIMFGLAAIVVAAQGNMLKGLFAAGLGIILSLIGQSVVTGEIRYNFGTVYLWDGIQLIPFVIGVFALAEMINLTVKGKTAVAATKIVGAALDNGAVRGIKDVFQHWPGFLRGSAIGTLVGIIPGVGGAAANFVSYTVAMQSSSHPETFGTGEIEGLIASESANNAKDGGSLIPTLGFGIPGSAETAVLLGAFILHGLIPGPLLIRDHPEVVWALIWGLVVANLVASGLGLAAARFLCKLANVNLSYIIPVVVIFSIMGSYAVRGSFFDVLVAVLFGVFGFFMRRTGFPVITMVIGFILGSLAEKAFMQSLMISGGDYSIFVTRPISLVLFVLLIAVLLIPVFRRYAGKKS